MTHSDLGAFPLDPITGHPNRWPGHHLLGGPSAPRHAAGWHPGEFGSQVFGPGAGDAPTVKQPQAWAAEQRVRQAAAWEADLFARELRARVASRLHLFNLRHADHAWQLRNSFGIASTAVAMLYLDADHSSQPPRWEVKVAGKLFPQTDQVTDPLAVLYDVCGLARDVVGAGQDPRREMSENPDPMTAGATYHGVGLSMLDTPAGSWHAVRKHASGGGLFVPGRILAVLADTTMLLADRFEHRHPEHYQIVASQLLDPSWLGLGRRWRYDPDLTRLDDPDTRPLWLRLQELHAILAGADHGR